MNMKHLLPLVLALFSASLTYGQVPQGISYQAIAFNTGGTAVANGNVGVKISILDNSASGTVVYAETHVKPTNAQGLFNLNIGQGSPLLGSFAAINWGSNNKFVKVELDPNGGTSYTSVGTNQLMSVPFALVAASITSSGGNTIQDQLLENRSANFGFKDSYDHKMYVFNATTGVWSSQTYNSQGSPALVAFNGGFYFKDTYDSKFYVFSSKTGAWTAQNYNAQGSPALMVDTLTGNYGFRDSYDNKMYVYNNKTGIWSSQTYNAQGSPALASSLGNFFFKDSYDNKFYIYSDKTGQWYPQTYDGQGSPTLVASNGDFYFRDSYANRIYAFSSNNASWSYQAYNSQGSPAVIISTID